VTIVTNSDFGLLEFCPKEVKDIQVMNFVLKNKVILIGVILGALVGYFYYHFYGCRGSCAITSSARNSTLYGALMGGLILSMFKKKSHSINDKNNE
jgi:uncharacterized protein DUF6132